MLKELGQILLQARAQETPMSVWHNERRTGQSEIPVLSIISGI